MATFFFTTLSPLKLICTLNMTNCQKKEKNQYPICIGKCAKIEKEQLSCCMYDVHLREVLFNTVNDFLTFRLLLCYSISVQHMEQDTPYNQNTEWQTSFAMDTIIQVCIHNMCTDKTCSFYYYLGSNIADKPTITKRIKAKMAYLSIVSFTNPLGFAE